MSYWYKYIVQKKESFIKFYQTLHIIKMYMTIWNMQMRQIGIWILTMLPRCYMHCLPDGI